MSIVRDLGLGVQGSEDFSIITCSTANQVLAATGNVSASGTAISGRIIDRMSEPFITSRYTVALPYAYVNSTRGSTEADRKITVVLKLQHGDSSGGGDMADYSTGSAPEDLVLFTSARTTPEWNWTTGPFKAHTKQAYYDLRGAHQFIRAVVTPTKSKQTTESSGDEAFHLGVGFMLLGADSVPQNPWTSRGSTSTSTST